MIESMKRVLSGEEAQEDGKKPVKPQDLVRLYETIIQVMLYLYIKAFSAFFFYIFTTHNKISLIFGITDLKVMRMFSRITCTVNK